MNRTITSIFSAGLGAAVYHFASQNRWMKNKPMKKARKRIMRMF
ncbi:YrzQ family protein [Metabacillus arenae]|uniref:YrzQ family protein n=1 Tax=Metabacillus arenae TaxID=2771434 RepID=A0A926RXR4_9BACI|nr:YrzQ family protein [Metabacillus arenae]MBD1381256.1 YrzQ family protein [Metabacillus arenae]